MPDAPPLQGSIAVFAKTTAARRRWQGGTSPTDTILRIAPLLERLEDRSGRAHIRGRETF
jgi:hypothetical protein